MNFQFGVNRGPSIVLRRLTYWRRGSGPAVFPTITNVNRAAKLLPPFARSASGAPRIKHARLENAVGQTNNLTKQLRKQSKRLHYSRTTRGEFFLVLHKLTKNNKKCGLESSVGDMNFKYRLISVYRQYRYLKK